MAYDDPDFTLQDAFGEKVYKIKSAITGSIPDTDDVQTTTVNAMNAVRERPLGLFFGMAALGFVIGSLLPATQLENKRLGPLVDLMKQRAKERLRKLSG